MTIFQSVSYELPYRKYLQQNDLLVAVPYIESKRNFDGHPFCQVQYALIHHTNINFLQQVDQKEYNSILDGIKVFKFSLYQPIYTHPIRFCILNDKEFNKLKKDPKLYSWDSLHATNTNDNSISQLSQ